MVLNLLTKKLSSLIIILGDAMNDLIIILVIIYLVVVYLVTQYFKIKQKMKIMQPIMATCTDIVVRRTYNKKYYFYFYKIKIKHDEITLNERKRLPIFQKQIKINTKYLMYVNEQNPDEYVSPTQVLAHKWYLYGAIMLIILSLLLFR